MKAILLMLGALSAAIIFVGCGTAVGRATGVDEKPPALDDKAMGSMAFSAADVQKVVDTAIAGERERQKEEERRLEEERRQEEERMRQAEEERREQERREETERIAEALETERRETARICEEAWAENDMDRVREFNCGKPQFATPIPTPIPTLTREEILERCRNSTPVVMGVSSYIRARELGQPAYARCLREHGIEEDLQWPGWPGMQILIIEECRINIPTPMLSGPGEGLTEEQIREGFFNYMQDMFTECLRENGIEEDIEYREFPDIERQREQDQDVAPLAEQAEELAEEEAPVDGTAEERIAALEERVAELTELIRDLTEALQSN